MCHDDNYKCQMYFGVRTELSVHFYRKCHFFYGVIKREKILNIRTQQSRTNPLFTSYKVPTEIGVEFCFGTSARQSDESDEIKTVFMAPEQY